MSTSGKSSGKRTRRANGSSGKGFVVELSKTEMWRLRQIEVMYFALQMAILEDTELKNRIDKLRPESPMELDHIIQEYIGDRVARYAH